jgi:amino acid transporter
MPVLGTVFAPIAEVTFGVVYGLAHALAIFLVIRLGELPNPHRRPLVPISIALTIFAMGVLILSHLLFAFGGNHPNKFQYAALFALIGWILALRKLPVAAPHPQMPAGERAA